MSSEESRLREEAARRQERRRRKLQNSDERMAKITGQPVKVSSDPKTEDLLNGHDLVNNLDNLISDNVHQRLPLTETVPDPPLEVLERDFLPPLERESPSGEGLDMNLLASLMTGNSAESSAAKPQVAVYHLLWVCLAVLVRLVLGSSHSFLLGDNMVIPFLLAVTGLIVTGLVDLRALQSASLVTAALVLCGVKAEKVALLTRVLHGMRLLGMCFSIYLFTFVLTHFFMEELVQT